MRQLQPSSCRQLTTYPTSALKRTQLRVRCQSEGQHSRSAELSQGGSRPVLLEKEKVLRYVLLGTKLHNDLAYSSHIKAHLSAFL